MGHLHWLYDVRSSRRVDRLSLGESDTMSGDPRHSDLGESKGDPDPVPAEARSYRTVELSR